MLELVEKRFKGLERIQKVFGKKEIGFSLCGGYELYDNSEGNVRNPSHPPRRVRWGPDSTDEMAGLHVQALAARESDVAELVQALWGKTMRSVGGGFYR